MLSGVLRAGLVQLRVLDDKTVDFYDSILGLQRVGETEDGRVMFKGYDEFHHHSVVLRKADSPGLDYVAYKVDSPETLERLRDETEKWGFPCTEIPAESDNPGFGKRYSFVVPTGHTFQLYAEAEMAARHPQIENPYPWEYDPTGLRAQLFDHLLLYGPNVDETERYFLEVWKMYAPEVVRYPDGRHFAAWLSCGMKAHDLAFVEYDRPNSLHHVAFRLEDWSDIGHAADLLAFHDMKIDVGPTRHSITRGKTIYFWEPSGNRIETFAGGYEAYPDHPQRYWDMEHVPRGIFYYERELVDSFMNVVT